MTVSNRSVSKGSSREAGPKKKTGSVNVRALSPIDWDRERPSCACGLGMRFCPDCEQWFCAAPGHAAHHCNLAIGGGTAP